MIFEHSTQAQNLAALRARFRDARGLEACRIGRWLEAHLTDAQLRTVFSLTLAQAQALRTRLQALRDRANAVDGSAGE